MLTAERLREVLRYDPATGHFTRAIRTAQRHQVGDRADKVSTSGNAMGYYRVCVDSQKFLAHRAAWLYVHGEWPANEIDHINGDKGDNRITNLRDVPRRINSQNRRLPRKDNVVSGFLGVTAHQGTWRAGLTDGSTRHYGAPRATPEAAYADYVEIKRKVHEGCTL